MYSEGEKSNLKSKLPLHTLYCFHDPRESEASKIMRRNRSCSLSSYCLFVSKSCVIIISASL